MNVNFKYNEPAEAEKIYFEQIFAEKPGGGIVRCETFDVPPSYPVVEIPENPGMYQIFFQFKVYDNLSKGGTYLKVHKNIFNEESTSTLRGLFIACGKESVEIADFETSPEYDVITLKTAFSKDVAKGSMLYFAESASANDAKAYLTMMGGAPVFVTGDWVYANQGDQAVRLINGANLRKETANIASEVAALLPTINLV